MRLIVPTVAELQASMARGGDFWRRPDCACEDDALPPVFVLQRAVAFITAQPALAPWFAPRLFWKRPRTPSSAPAGLTILPAI